MKNNKPKTKKVVKPVAPPVILAVVQVVALRSFVAPPFTFYG